MQRVRQSARGAIAPVACVQAVRAAATLPYLQGMAREKELMATLFNSGQARALQYSFFAQRAVGKWSLPSGARWDTSKARPIRKAAVIGKHFRLISFILVHNYQYDEMLGLEHELVGLFGFLFAISKFALTMEN